MGEIFKILKYNQNKMEIKYQWIIYLTFNIANDKIYIGVHKTTQEDYDYYLGCGVYSNRPSTYKKSKTPFQHAVNKYGIKSFKRKTLFTFDNEQDAYDKEAELVNEEFVKRKDTYNLILGGRLNTDHANQYIKVYMYNISGDYIREFETVTEANKFLNPKATTSGHISRNIKLGYLTNGYQLSYEKLPFMKEYEKHKIERSDEYKENISKRCSKPIGRYSLEWELLEEYSSLTKCREAGYNNAGHVMAGTRSHCKGFLFKYLEIKI